MADFVAKQIVKEFATPAEPLRILDGVSIELTRGDGLAVVGPSGSGKSTFLHIAGTLEMPTSGEVSLLGIDFRKLSDRELADVRNQRIGFIFQDHHLLPQLTALENVLIPVLATGKAERNQIERGKYLLNQVGLEHRLTHRPAELSGGEKQRVAVARALMNAPALILADEPTGSLDPANAEKIGELLTSLPHADPEHPTILICVTHSEHLASSFSRQVRLEHGKFV